MLDNEVLLDKTGYDMWDNHLKYVVSESVRLAEEYGADLEIVIISALLHDIALLKHGTSVKADHHTMGKDIAKEILKSIGYPNDKINRVCGCILHHRSSKNAKNIEETCVADADILAHFSNLPMILKGIYAGNQNSSIDTINTEIKNVLNSDYNDLSDRTQKVFAKQFETICNTLLKK